MGLNSARFALTLREMQVEEPAQNEDGVPVSRPRLELTFGSLADPMGHWV
jgi:hypothetical protein